MKRPVPPTPLPPLAQRVVDECAEHIFKAPVKHDDLAVPHGRCGSCRERFDGASCPNCGAAA